MAERGQQRDHRRVVCAVDQQALAARGVVSGRSQQGVSCLQLDERAMMMRRDFLQVVEQLRQEAAESEATGEGILR